METTSQQSTQASKDLGSNEPRNTLKSPTSEKGAQLREAQQEALPPCSFIQEGLLVVLNRLFELSGDKIELGNLVVSKNLLDRALGVFILKETNRHKNSLEKAKGWTSGNLDQARQYRSSSRGSSSAKLLKCKTPPPISLKDYIFRLTDLGCLSDSVLITALIYIIRIVAKNPELDFSSFNAHKIISTSLFLATKYVIDHGIWYLKDFGELSGVSARTLRKESSYMAQKLLDWDLFVPQKEFKQVRNLLVSAAEATRSARNAQN